jgi:anti-sigma regulatory factor (Ser/Thr protein kinase)
LINVAFAGRPVTILCPYDADKLGPQTLADAEASHPLLIDASGERASTTYGSGRLAADCNQPFPAVVGPNFTFDAINQARARQFASDHATRLGLDSDHAELKLIVDELTANSVVHGGGTGTLRVWAECGYLVCEVRDAGHFMDPLAGRQPAAPTRTDGRGLVLVTYLSDLVQQHTCPQGTLTRVYLKLPAHSEFSTNPGELSPAAPRARHVPPRPTPLPLQTYEALHAAERFGRYLPQDVATSTERPAPASAVQSNDGRPIEPVLEALTAVEALARVVDRWRARLVRLARTRGAPWNEIGHSLGVSKQAAHERYGQARRRKSGRELPGQVGPVPPARST